MPCGEAGEVTRESLRAAAGALVRPSRRVLKSATTFRIKGPVAPRLRRRSLRRLSVRTGARSHRAASNQGRCAP